jgi:hypothetical protein
MQLVFAKHPHNKSMIAEHNKNRYLCSEYSGLGFEDAPIRAYVFDRFTYGTEIYQGNSMEEAMSACDEHATSQSEQAA